MATPELQTNVIGPACFGLVLTDEKIKEIEQSISSLPSESQTKDYAQQLLTAVKKWWDLPESKSNSKNIRLPVSHKDKEFDLEIRKLEKKYQTALWDCIPWMEDILKMEQVFDKVTERPLRDNLFLLVWYTKELCLDREPVTNDFLNQPEK